MAEIPTSEYDCSQAELYAALRLLIANYNTKQAELATFKAKYTTAFATTFTGEVDAADALPDRETRESLAQTLRTELVPLNKTCLQNWQTLKQYIIEVYAPEAQPANLQAAGSTYYNAASNEDWENGIQMNQNANAFIAANSVQLLDGGNNMPAGFAAQYITDSTAFETKYNAFIVSTQTTEATVAKIELNNAIFKKGMALCVDAQTKYMNNAAAAKLFTWDNLLTIISPDAGGGGTGGGTPVVMLDVELGFPIPSGISEIDLSGIDMAEVDEVEIQNTASGTISAGFAVVSSALPSPVTVTAGSSETGTPAALGFDVTNTHLFLVNTGGASTFRVILRG